MNIKDKRIKEKLKKVVVDRRETTIYAFMGDLIEGVVEVPNKPSYVYATVAFSGQVLEVKNSRVPTRLRLPIEIGYPRSSHLLQIISIWDVYPNLDIPEVAHHNHTWGTSDNPSWIHKKQFLPLLPSAAGGMVVRVGGGDYSIGASVRTMNTTDFDMTSQIPTEDAKWVSVSIDLDGNITYTDGDSYPNRYLLTVENLPSVPDGERRLFACKVYLNQTEIIDTLLDTDIFDPRFTATSDVVSWSDIEGKPSVFPPDPTDPLFEGYTGRTVSASDPTVDDDIDAGFLNLHLWLNSASKQLFILVDNSTGAAIWVPAGGGANGDIFWSINGYLAVTDPCAVPHRITKDMTIAYVYISTGENPGTAGTTSIDIDLNGTGSILSAPLDLDWDDADGWVKVVPVVVDLVEGDLLTPSITSMATGAIGLQILVVPDSVSGVGGFNLILSDDSGSTSNVGEIQVQEGGQAQDVGGGTVKIIIPTGRVYVASNTWKAKSGTWNVYTGLDWFYNSSSANGDYLEYDVYLAAGTYDLYVSLPKYIDRPISEYLLDGVSLGTIDQYGASDESYQGKISGFVVTNSGFKTLKVLINGKNASSSGYQSLFRDLVLVQTA